MPNDYPDDSGRSAWADRDDSPTGKPVLHILRPDERALLPLVVSSPHSGRDYTQEFLERARLPLDVLRSGEDFHVDTLAAPAPAYGATLLTATFPRVVCDVNRASLDLDPRMIADAPDDELRPTVRGRVGLGSVPVIVSGGRQLYSSRLSMMETTTRLRRYWHPYHTALSGLIADLRRKFGFCVLLDLHSMPPGIDGSKADCVIGDRFGTASEPLYVQALARSLVAQGLHVARNHPFSGGYITSHYGQPSQGVSAMQLELSRALYVNRLAGGGSGLNPRFGEKIERVIADLAHCVAGQVREKELYAAE